jgi:hypothetical protein
MNTILNNVKVAGLNLAQAIASLLVPAGASTEVKTKAELAVIGGQEQVPTWLKELQADPVAFLEAANIKGAVPVLSAGTLDGADQLALVRFWGAPGKADGKGSTIWASTDAGKVFAYFRAWGQKPDAANPEAEITAINPETGEAEDWRMAVPAGVTSLKFKLANMGMSYEMAVNAISDYISVQDGSRKDYVLLAQCDGAHHDETSGVAKLPTGHRVQPIKGYILFQVPKVSNKGNANLASLCAPTMSAAADAVAVDASPRVTAPMPFDASPMAAADEL